MSTQKYELFYNKLVEASFHLETEGLTKLFEKDFIKDVTKMNWILKTAIKYRDIKIINFLISSGIKIDVLNNANQTALHVAAYDDFFEIIDSLFQHCNNDLNYTDINGFTHFHIACITGNVKIAEYFLQNGVDVNIRYRPDVLEDCKSFTALHFAVKYAQVQIVELLLKYGADPNSVDHFNITPLHLICRGLSRRIKALRMPDYFVIDENQFDAFISQNNELKITRFLIHYGSNINAMENSGNTPLFFIFQDDTLEQINAIFHPLMCDINAKYKFVRQFRKKQKEKVKLLLKNNANVKIFNNNKDTILHIVISNMNLSHCPEIFSGIYFDDIVNNEIIELFLKSGANVNAKNNKHETPLQIAISLLNFKTVKILIDYNADIKCIKFDRGNNTRFHYYTNVLPCLEVTENMIKIIDILSKKGFNLSQKDNLIILKFFVCNNIDCPYADSEDQDAPFKLKNLLELGAGMNIKNTLNKFPKNIYSCTFREQSLRKQMISQLYKHLTILEIGSLYVSKEVVDCLKLKIRSLDKCILKFFSTEKSLNKNDVQIIENEIHKMKTIMLNNCTTLHDILSMHPHDIYSHIKNYDYKSIFESDDFKYSFSNYAGIIKGHFAKSLIRRYVLKSANQYIRCLTTVTLPDLCCEKILNYLSNESLLDLYLAITVDLNG